MPRLSQQELDDLGIGSALSYQALQVEYPGFGISSRSEWGPAFSNLPDAGARFEASNALSNGILQAKTMQFTMAQMAKNVGIPVLDAFTAVAEAVGIDIAGMLAQALQQLAVQAVDQAMEFAKNALDGAMKGLEIASDFVASIPLYGAVVEILLSLVKAIVGLVTIIKQQKEAKKMDAVKEYPFPAYVPAVDMDAFNAGLLLVADTKDWTWIWRPPALGPSQQHAGARFGAVDITGDAFTIIGLASTGAPGCTPGLAWVHAGAFVLNNPFSARADDTGMILRPSLRQQNIYLWKSFSQNNLQPSIYCIDADRIRDEWAQYVQDFWSYLIDAPLNDDQRAALQMTFAGTADKPGPFFGMNLFSGKHPSDVEAENVLVVHEASIIQQRQWALLDTVMTAYVDPDMVAVKPGSALRAKWSDRKQDLLKHPARCSVSLDDVQDVIYLQALIDSGVGTPACSAIGDIAGAPQLPSQHVPKGIPTVGPFVESGPLSTRRPYTYYPRNGNAGKIAASVAALLGVSLAGALE